MLFTIQKIFIDAPMRKANVTRGKPWAEPFSFGKVHFTINIHKCQILFIVSKPSHAFTVSKTMFELLLVYEIIRIIISIKW